MEKNPSSEVIELADLDMTHPLYLEVFSRLPFNNYHEVLHGIIYFYDRGWKARIVDQEKYTLFLLGFE